MEIYNDEDGASANTLKLNEPQKSGGQLRKTPTRSPGRVSLAAISPNAIGARQSGAGSTTKKKLGMKTAVPRKVAAEAPSDAKQPPATGSTEQSELSSYLPANGPSPPPIESLSTPQHVTSLDTGSAFLPKDLSRVSFGGMISSLHSELSTIHPVEAAAVPSETEELKQELSSANARIESLELREMELESTVSCLEQQIDDTVDTLTLEHQTEVEELTEKWNTEKDTLKQQIKTLRDEIAANEGLSALVSRNDDMMKQQEENWQKKLEETLHELKEMSARVDDSDRQCEVLKNTVEELESKNVELQAQECSEQNALEASNKALQKEVEELQCELEKAAAEQARADELQQQLTEKETSHNAKITELDAVHREELQVARSEVQEQLAQIEREIDDTVAELERQHQEKVTAMQAEISAAKCDAAQAVVAKARPVSSDDLVLMGEFETVESVLATGEELREVNAKMSLTIEQRDAEVSELQSTAESLTDKLSNAISSLEVCKVERDEAMNTGARAAQHAAELDSKLAETTSRLDETTQELGQMQQKLEQAVVEATQNHQERINILQQQLVGAKEQMADAQNKVAELTDQATDLQERLNKTQGSLDKTQDYTDEQRQRIDELSEQSMAHHEAVKQAQFEKIALERRVSELQGNVAAGEEEMVKNKEQLCSLQDEMTALREEVECQRGVAKDGKAAIERCDELEEKMQLLNTELLRAQTQIRRSMQKATDCENKMNESTRTLKSTQRALAAAEERARDNEEQVREERAARELAESAEADANSRRAQVEFEQQLAAGEKAQMMQKLDMLLTTRGEPMETIEMVRVQTELEVEVRNLKETVQRLQHQLEAARNETANAKANEEIAEMDSNVEEEWAE